MKVLGQIDRCSDADMQCSTYLESRQWLYVNFTAGNKPVQRMTLYEPHHFTTVTEKTPQKTNSEVIYIGLHFRSGMALS